MGRQHASDVATTAQPQTRPRTLASWKSEGGREEAISVIERACGLTRSPPCCKTNWLLTIATHGAMLHLYSVALHYAALHYSEAY